MVDFLDKGRPGMASTFLVRMKVGPILVDAKGVSRLYDTRSASRDLLLMVLAAHRHPGHHQPGERAHPHRVARPVPVTAMNAPWARELLVPR